MSKAFSRSHSIPGRILDSLKKIDRTLRSHGTVNSELTNQFEVLLLPKKVLPSALAQSLTLANPKWCLPTQLPHSTMP